MSAPESARPDRAVLYVDDDAATRYLLSRALAREGVSVTEATGAHEGLALMKQYRFRLVISDYRMPDGSGTWMLKQAASSGLLEGAEVLLFTGSTHIEGGAGLKIISKDGGTEPLVSQVLQLLGRPRPLAPPESRMVRIELVLYTVGRSAASMRALRQMKALLARYEPSQVDFQVVDLAQGRPASAEEDHILLTPTLVQRSPLPRTWVVGDLEDTTVVEDLLEHSGVERMQ